MSYNMLCSVDIYFKVNTKTKLFCGCSTKCSQTPNVQCCPVCTGLPGSMPSLNQKVVQLSYKMGQLLGAKLNENSSMGRKHVFNLSLPKYYKITQDDNPICLGGMVGLASGEEIKIKHLAIEEGGGTLIKTDENMLVDYNPSGVPFLQVSTRHFLGSIQTISDLYNSVLSLAKNENIMPTEEQDNAYMNLSLMLIEGEDLNQDIVVNVKNINSYDMLQKVIDFEYLRQKEILDAKGIIPREIRVFDEKLNSTRAVMPTQDVDYKFFVDPNLTKII